MHAYIRRAARRVASQGSAADVLKLATVRVCERIARWRDAEADDGGALSAAAATPPPPPPSGASVASSASSAAAPAPLPRLVMQIHDELVYEARRPTPEGTPAAAVVRRAERAVHAPCCYATASGASTRRARTTHPARCIPTRVVRFAPNARSRARLSRAPRVSSLPSSATIVRPRRVRGARRRAQRQAVRGAAARRHGGRCRARAGAARAACALDGRRQVVGQDAAGARPVGRGAAANRAARMNSSAPSASASSAFEPVATRQEPPFGPSSAASTPESCEVWQRRSGSVGECAAGH